MKIFQIFYSRSDPKPKNHVRFLENSDDDDDDVERRQENIGTSQRFVGNVVVSILKPTNQISKRNSNKNSNNRRPAPRWEIKAQLKISESYRFYSEEDSEQFLKNDSNDHSHALVSRSKSSFKAR